MRRIKFERTSRRLSQHAVASRTNIRQPIISRIERGRRLPTAAQLIRLSEFFNVAPDDLLKDVAVASKEAEA